MKLSDLYEAEDQREPNPLVDQRNDSSRAEKTDTRKTRLTLEQIHRLRKLNDVRIAEYQETIKKVKKQFQPPAAEPM